MAPLRNNPWDPNEDGFTPIVVAVFHEHIEIDKMLTSLADNLQIEMKILQFIRQLKMDKQKLSKILTPLNENSNAANKCGRTPLQLPIQKLSKTENSSLQGFTFGSTFLCLTLQKTVIQSLPLHI